MSDSHKLPEESPAAAGDDAAKTSQPRKKPADAAATDTASSTPPAKTDKAAAKDKAGAKDKAAARDADTAAAAPQKSSETAAKAPDAAASDLKPAEPLWEMPPLAVASTQANPRLDPAFGMPGGLAFDDGTPAAGKAAGPNRESVTGPDLPLAATDREDQDRRPLFPLEDDGQEAEHTFDLDLPADAHEADSAGEPTLIRPYVPVDDSREGDDAGDVLPGIDRDGETLASLIGLPADDGDDEDEDDETRAVAMAPHDALAAAVHSALHNVYGPDTGPVRDALGRHRPLRDALASEEDRSADRYFGRFDDNDGWDDDAATVQLGTDRGHDADDEDTTTEAVLDYLYGQSGHDRRGTASFDDRATYYGTPTEGGFDAPSSASFQDSTPHLGERGAYEHDQPAMAGREGGGYYRDATLRAPHNQPDVPPPAYMPETRAAHPSLSAPPASVVPMADDDDAQDSGHLLGAAGLGLIGGIALSGVLAVFVFNSFVGGEAERPAQPDGGKIVERLSTGDRAEDRSGTGEGPAAYPVRTPATAERLAAAGTAPAGPAVPRQEQAEERQEGSPAPERSDEAEAAPAARIAALDDAAPEPRPRTSTDANELLSVTDVTGQSGQPIRLAISLASTALDRDSLINIRGLPKDAKLSAGIDIGGGHWLLPPQRLDGLALTVTSPDRDPFTLEAQLLKDDARTALSEPVSFTVTVAAAADTEPVRTRERARSAGDDAQATAATGTGQPSQDVAALEKGDEEPLTTTNVEVQKLIREGNKLMREGDIAAARRYYEQAADSGEPEAALAMGRSYDPSYFEQLPVKTGKPDPATSFEWYKKALDGGIASAQVRIETLKQWLLR